MRVVLARGIEHRADILGGDILRNATEKLLALRERWANENADLVLRLLRAHQRAAAFVQEPDNREEVAAILADPFLAEIVALLPRLDSLHRRTLLYEAVRATGQRRTA